MRNKLIELIHECEVEALKSNLHLSPERIADYLLERGVIVPPVKIGTLLWGVFCEKPHANDEPYYYVEACRVDEIMYFPNNNFLFSVREVNYGYGHNMRFEEMYFEFEKAEKALEERKRGCKDA